MIRRRGWSSTQSQNSEGDLADDAMTCEGFGENTDDETEHGHPTVEQFRTHHALTFDLAGSCILVPLVLCGG